MLHSFTLRYAVKFNILQTYFQVAYRVLMHCSPKTNKTHTYGFFIIIIFGFVLFKGQKQQHYQSQRPTKSSKSKYT